MVSQEDVFVLNLHTIVHYVLIFIRSDICLSEA